MSTDDKQRIIIWAIIVVSIIVITCYIIINNSQATDIDYNKQIKEKSLVKVELSDDKKDEINKKLSEETLFNTLLNAKRSSSQDNVLSFNSGFFTENEKNIVAFSFLDDMDIYNNIILKKANKAVSTSFLNEYISKCFDIGINDNKTGVVELVYPSVTSTEIYKLKKIERYEDTDIYLVTIDVVYSKIKNDNVTLFESNNFDSFDTLSKYDSQYNGSDVFFTYQLEVIGNEESYKFISLSETYANKNIKEVTIYN